MLATRGILTPAIESELREKIAAARHGARPEEVVPSVEPDAELQDAARTFIAWCHEWREVARASITRRDYRISLGLAHRRGPSEDVDDEEDVDQGTAAASAA